MSNVKESGTAMSALGNTALMGTEKIPSYGNYRMTPLQFSKPFQTQATFFQHFLEFLCTRSEIIDQYTHCSTCIHVVDHCMGTDILLEQKNQLLSLSDSYFMFHGIAC